MTKEDKHAKYESSAQRKQVLSIRTSKSDDTDEWQAIVTWLQNLGEGSAKTGLHKLAKQHKVI